MWIGSSRTGDHPERGDDIADDRVFGERPPVREAARDPRAQETGLGSIADLVASVEKRIISPLQIVRSAIAPDVGDNPGDLRVLGREGEGRNREQAIAFRLGVPAVLEDRSVDHDQLARERDNLARAAAVLPQLRHRLDGEVVGVGKKNLGIGARPRVNRLFVVTHGEDVAVFARQLVNDGVLNGIEILELVDEDAVPAPAHRPADGLVPKQLSGLQHQGVEVDELALIQEFLIAGEEHSVVRPQLIAAKRYAANSTSRCRARPEALRRRSTERW